ncbi:ionic transporter y4hA [Saccharopolyspora indica]|uniref:calcium:proton antiporter n=1 Tax=Saccharopolyspora indica TaxID=1229659 RepID=UPI0022EA671F|nr:ionic transporter y4hA [Saccharopolyspora indica]MDA3648760.1 ionic transporter y4hA [Saccharopolyspora indica]
MSLRSLLSLNVVIPVLAMIALAVAWPMKDSLGTGMVIVVAVLLAGAVLTAVHHAEVVAHKVGEPYGSLVLAVAVTVIEVALIVSMMISGGEGAATLARDTIFAAIMITMNGIAGLSLLVGALRYGLPMFNAEGTGAAVATVATMGALTLVLPAFTTTVPGPEYSPNQLVFAALASVVLYTLFVSTQTRRHRDFFLPVTDKGTVEPEDDHAEPPTGKRTAASLVLLLIALVAVVGLAKVESPAIEAAVAAAGFPNSFVGVVIAMLVLLPETIAAVRASVRRRMQISLNLAYGSAIASIGLTIPAIAVATIWLQGPLHLGLGATQIVLFALTIVVSTLTVVPGRATRLQGGVHLALLAAFLFLAVNP